MTINLASRVLGASVMAASDEAFGDKERLVLDTPADFTPGTFGPKGEIVDGWETRRRRSPGHDWAIVRLGVPGVIEAVDVDTSFFTGNFPATCRVEACSVDGYPSADQVAAAAWQVVVAWTDLTGGAHHVLPVDDPARYTHVRLSIDPDGGVARLRVFGRAAPDRARFDGGPVDLVARELGGEVEDCSDSFYTSPDVLTLPDLPRSMGEGWETRRRRGDGNDWVVFRLAVPGHIAVVEVDTSYYVYNASAAFELSGTGPGWAGWRGLMPRTPLQPDTRHRFAMPRDGSVEVERVRLDVFPDGGLSRLRLWGRPGNHFGA